MPLELVCGGIEYRSESSEWFWSADELICLVDAELDVGAENRCAVVVLPSF